MDSTQLSSPSPTFIEDTHATARATRKREEVVTSVPTVDGEVPTLDDFLYHLYDGARDVTVDDLVQFTQKSFESIENWCEAKSSSGHLAAVKKARVVGKDYVTAIKMSVKAAAHGITFVADILRLYECIQCHAPADTGALIKKMRETTRLAHVDAKVTYERFSTVRQTLFQIKDRQDDHKRGHKMEQESNLTSALQKKTIGNACEVVDKFASWWSAAETMTSILGNQVGGSKTISPLRVQNLRRNWEALQNQYVLYKNNIGPLSDSCPVNIMRASAPWYRKILMKKPVKTHQEKEP